MTKPAYTTEAITQYLLGECSEAEREALENALLEYDAVFTQVEEREDELIDAYVRGQMPAPLRTRFARRLSGNPALRKRVAAAEILLPRLDEAARPPAAPALSGWQALRLAWRNQTLALRFAWAAALLLCAGGGTWMLRELGRLRGEVRELRATQTTGEQRAAVLAQQTALERERNAQLAAELERLRQQTAVAAASPTPAPAVFATLMLTAVVRGTATGTPRVTLTPEAQQLRLLLRTLPGKQPRYRAEVQSAADLRPVWQVENLKPTNRNHTAFTLTIPADKLPAGEYVVKIDGVETSGDTFTLLSTNFVVAKK